MKSNDLQDVPLLCCIGTVVTAVVIVLLTVTGCTPDSSGVVDDIPPSILPPVAPTVSVSTPTPIPTPSPKLASTLISSYNKDEVPAPCVSIYVHALARHYYISVPPELAARVEEALSLGNPLAIAEPDPSKHMGCAIGVREYPVGYYGAGELFGYGITRNADGEYGLGLGREVVEATQEARMLLGLAAESTGWDFDTDLEDFKDIATIEVLFGDKVLATVTESLSLVAFEEFLQSSVHSVGPMKTQEQRVELRCTLGDGTAASIVADPANNMLWLPPVSYYMYASYGWPDEDHILGETRILQDILGLENWPDEVFEICPDEFWERLYERLGVAPPSEAALRPKDEVT